MKSMTKIIVEADYYNSSEDSFLRAIFSCHPATTFELRKGREDEINITFQYTESEDIPLELTLTEEQVQEFIWALTKMVQVAHEYRKRTDPPQEEKE